jgi:hypothetical protein
MKEIANHHSIESDFYDTPENLTAIERAYRIGQTVVRGAKSILQVDHDSPLSARLHYARRRDSRSFVPDPTFSLRNDQELFERMAYVGDPGDIPVGEFLKSA